MSIEGLAILAGVKGITAAIKSIVGDIGSITKSMKGLMAGYRSTRAANAERSWNILCQTVAVIEDYFGMLRDLERSVRSEPKNATAYKVLSKYLERREQLLLCRRMIFAELSEAIADEKLCDYHNFFLSVMRLFDVSELHLESGRGTGSLSTYVVAVEGGADFTTEHREAVLRRIARAREFLDGRWSEIIRNYFFLRPKIGMQFFDKRSHDQLVSRMRGTLHEASQPKKIRKKTKKKMKKDNEN